MPRGRATTEVSELIHNLKQAVASAQSNKPCKLCIALESFDPKEAAEIQRAIEATRPDGKRALGPKTLTRILNESGVKISKYMVERHQNEGHR
jgi:hypothetical protein